jgi:Tfp pilus assembly protein PilE
MDAKHNHKPNNQQSLERGTPMGITQITAPMSKFQSRLAESEKEGFAGKVNQLGINMVDLMMWLVIAALLLAAALQGIGFYQKAAWNYQLQSDASAVRTYMEAQYTLNNNVYPTLVKATPPADLKMTSSNGVSNVVAAAPTTTGGWSATLCSGALTKAGVVTGNTLTIGSDSADAKGNAATC